MSQAKKLASLITYRVENYEEFHISIKRLKKKKSEPEARLQVDIKVKKTVEDELYSHRISTFDTEDCDPTKIAIQVIEEVDKNIKEQLSSREKYYHARREQRERRDEEKKAERRAQKRLRAQQKREAAKAKKEAQN